MDWNRIKLENATTIGRAEAICRSIVPELEIPLYILPESETPGVFKCAGDCRGYTRPTLDAELRHVLSDRGVWRGRGHAMVVDVDPEAQPDQFVRTVLHELAHGLDGSRKQGTVGTLPIDQIPEWGLFLVEPPTAPMKPADRSGVPWRHHDAAWIRTAIHIATRATGRWLLVHEPGHGGRRHTVRPGRLSTLRASVRRRSDRRCRLATRPDHRVAIARGFRTPLAGRRRPVAPLPR